VSGINDVLSMAVYVSPYRVRKFVDESGDEVWWGTDFVVSETSWAAWSGDAVKEAVDGDD
jgi:hypothetical protein